MNGARLIEEAEIVEESHPGTRAGVDNAAGQGWLYVPRFELPPGWNRGSTELLVVVPPQYPYGPPESFFIETGLRDRIDRGIDHYFQEQSGYNPYGERGWAWFCYHIEQHSWRPRGRARDGDNLFLYLRVIRHALSGVVSSR